MARRRFSLGIDFGTESGRALLVDVATGDEIATAVYRYADGVIDRALPGGASLPPDWALQNPADYIETLRQTIPAVLESSGVAPADVVGIGVDFTSCTMLPTDADGVPLCVKPEWRSNPHAWTKLWKHHAAQPEADGINAIAQERGEAWPQRYGGKYSSEWFFSKVWQILDEAPEVYAAADRLIEAADWIVWRLTGRETRNLTTAGYKAIYDTRAGFVSDAFLAALDPRLEHVVDEKMLRTISPPAECAGGLTEEMATLTGLRAGTPVAVGQVDAHVSVPAADISEPGKMLMIMGTSICHMLLGREQKPVDGMCGVVEDGILPGFYGYEAGQSGAGDILAWFVRTWASSGSGRDPHEELEAQARTLKPGESGLVALDWWNGNRAGRHPSLRAAGRRHARHHPRGHVPGADRVHSVRHAGDRGELREVRHSRRGAVRLRRDAGEEHAADADIRRRHRALHQARPLRPDARARRSHVRRGGSALGRRRIRQHLPRDPADGGDEGHRLQAGPAQSRDLR